MGSTFLPGRCAHIDTVGSNLLIRGNLPLIGKDLHYAFKEIEEASCLTLTNKTLVEIPIIDNVGERSEFVPIMRAFGVDPDRFPASSWPWWTQESYNPNELHGKNLRTEGMTLLGSVLWRPFEGLPSGSDPKTFLAAPGWDYGGFIDQLVHMMKAMRNTVFYVHCQLGADRTGAAHIGYLMRSKNMSLDEALKVSNSSTTAGPPNEDYMRLVKAYAKVIGR
jgi:hypothetical protein